MKQLIKLSAIALAVSMLADCGGQVEAKPLNICLQPCDHIVAMKSCGSTIRSIGQETSVATFVAKQMQSTNNVMAWLGRDRAWKIADFTTILVTP
jgi:hypothetical protein